MRATRGHWTLFGHSRFNCSVAPPAQLVGKPATTCVEDESVGSSERFCCEELDTHHCTSVSLSAILACLSSELATRRLAHLRPHLQSHAPRAHSSTRLDRTHRVVCESSLLLGLLFRFFYSLHRLPWPLRCFGLSALGRRFSRALVFNELVARPRADPRVFFHTLLHVRLLARNFTCCACSAGCFTSTTLSLHALRVGSRSFQSCGCCSGLSRRSATHGPLLARVRVPSCYVVPRLPGQVPPRPYTGVVRCWSPAPLPRSRFRSCSRWVCDLQASYRLFFFSKNTETDVSTKTNR